MIPFKPINSIDLRNHNCANNLKVPVGPIHSWETLHNDLESFWLESLNGREFDLMGHSFVNLRFIITACNFTF